jgi:hypothetical protein
VTRKGSGLHVSIIAEPWKKSNALLALFFQSFLLTFSGELLPDLPHLTEVALPKLALETTEI